METFLLVFVGVVLAFSSVLLRRRYAAFHGQTPADYDDGSPTFDLQTHLNGDMVCDGVIFGPLGRVTSTFVADFRITWDGDVAVMDELFRFNDGTTQQRQWTIRLKEDSTFETLAADVVKGGHGTLAGPAALMRYAIRLPEETGGHTLNTVDWMYLTPGGVIVNRSQFRKFGIKVAELVATIRPKGA
ncbi:DUF3833 family protein [Sulfitobacter sp. JB4-11]|uniref:DUF3833 family protein n=1 Tax=Sulfitobacter rhodophyticola TaxID=3238304 RepID=UPI003515EACE